jgi:hypothetical protein
MTPDEDRRVDAMTRRLLGVPLNPAYYVLDENNQALPCALSEWAAMFEDFPRRQVAENFVGTIRVSTIFLGLNHQFGHGPPLIFETMIFGGRYDGYQWRTSTWEQAETTHALMLKRVHKLRLIPPRVQELMREIPRMLVHAYSTIQHKAGATHEDPAA